MLAAHRVITALQIVQGLAMRVLQLDAITPEPMGRWRRVKIPVKRGGTFHLTLWPATQHQFFLPETSQDGIF